MAGLVKERKVDLGNSFFIVDTDVVHEQVNNPAPAVPMTNLFSKSLDIAGEQQQFR